MTCAVCSPVTDAVDNLAGVRARRAMSQNDLGHAAGVSGATVHKAEIGAHLPHPRNRVLIIEALIRAAPLKDSEIQAVSRDLQVDTARIVRLQSALLKRSAFTDEPGRDRLLREVDRLIDQYGLDRVRRGFAGLIAGMDVMDQERDMLGSDEEAPTPARLIVRTPPVARPDGGEEFTEVEYARAPQKPAAPAPKKQRRRA